MAANLDQINVLAELERSGVRYEWKGEDEVVVRCPFHDDEKPSLYISTSKRVFQCRAAGCETKGDVVTLLAKLWLTTRQVALVELGRRYLVEDVRVISPDTVERYHAQIWRAGPLLRELDARAVTPELIRQYRLGCDGSRVTIPIKNASGDFVNIRRYLPGAPSKEKMRNTKGHSQQRLFPIEQLKYRRLLLAGGECKAIVAAAQLNPHGVGAITSTAGEGNWDPSLSTEFRGKEVFICFDVDEAGQRCNEQRAAQLSLVADRVAIVRLPLDVDQFPHGDVNDFVAGGGELLPLIEAAETWEAKGAQARVDENPTPVNLRQATKAESVGRRLSTRAVVAAMHTTPYAIPRSVVVECDRQQKECAFCSVTITDEDSYEVRPESCVVLEMLESHRSAQREALMREIGVPLSCRSCQFRVNSYHNAEDVRVSPELEITNRASERTMQPAVFIGDGAELNETYNVVGRVWPHPKTQQTTLLISSYAPAKDALSTYVPVDLEEMLVFRPTEWTLDGLTAKLDDVYADFEANVTRVFQRRDLHLLMDLAWHSPLLLRFDGRVVKGWVEVLALGDSSQGKSEVACGSGRPGGLLAHYGLGEKVECKNASAAGLIGGVQQMGTKWFITWGKIPTHDKRLVILEELKGASVETIGKLTDMRSSGIAEIPKIEKQKTHARTRIIALSNPRSDRPLARYAYGVQAVKELIGSPEDIRRFDAVLLLAAGDVDSAAIDLLRSERPRVPHTHESELCRRLVLWAWTRSVEQIDFRAEREVLRASTDLCADYSEDIPIVDRGSMRMKLARLSTALACRTFSTDESMERAVVLPCHVEAVVAFLRRSYSSRACGYEDYTKAERSRGHLADAEVVKLKINATPFPEDFVSHLLHADALDMFDIQDWCGWDRSAAQEMLSLLVRKSALYRDGRRYRKSSAFIELLKSMQRPGGTTKRPEFVEEEF